MPSFSAAAFRRVVRASGLYDLVVTLPFAAPWSFTLVAAQLSAANVQLGGEPLPAFSTIHVLIACLLGSLVVVWSVLRVLDPQRRFGRFDAVARILFSLWFAWALWQGRLPVLYLFLVPEVLWGVAQLWPARAEVPRDRGLVPSDLLASA